MTTPEVTSLITSIALLVGALTAPLTAFLTWRNGQQSKERSQILASQIKSGSENLETKIQGIHDATNGMKTELVNEVRMASEARGELKGRADAIAPLVAKVELVARDPKKET